MVVEHGRHARVSRCCTPLYCVSGRAPPHCSARRSESRAPKNCAAWTAPARILRRTAAWKKSEGTCRGPTAWPARPDFGRRHAPMGGSCRRPGAALRRRVVEERYVPPCDLESRQYNGPAPLGSRGGRRLPARTGDTLASGRLRVACTSGRPSSPGRLQGAGREGRQAVRSEGEFPGYGTPERPR